MDHTLLEALEKELIHHVFKQSWGIEWRGQDIPNHLFRSFATHAQYLSDSFTKHRKDLSPGYIRTKPGRASYLLYFHLANMVRTMAVLDEAIKRKVLSAGSHNVLDLGAGSAPSCWAIAFFAQQHDITLKKIIAVDQEKAILQDAKQLWQQVEKYVENSLPYLTTVRTNVIKQDTRYSLKKLGSFDLIFCSNMLNEWELSSTNPQLSFIRFVLQHMLSENGLMFIIEPALQKVSRQLQVIRDILVTKHHSEIPLPCTHQELCVLNQEPRDWCHFDVPWDTPPLRKRLEHYLHHKSTTLKYSYLVIQKKTTPCDSDVYRVISNPLDTKKNQLLILCAPKQKIVFTFPHHKKINTSFIKTIQKGDLVRIKNLTNIPPNHYRKLTYGIEIEFNDTWEIKKI